jgi:hypothetical protein
MLKTFVLVVFLVVAVMAWQHLRYLRIRRDSAQDRQHVFHSSYAFHVIVFFKLGNADKVVDTARLFAAHILCTSKARLIYAGQTACTVYAKQLGNSDWDGVLMFEYPSRTDYQETIADGHFPEARHYFVDSYVHGMRRNRQTNVGVPQFLLRLRIRDFLSGRWHVEPLQKSPIFATFPEYATWRTREARLRAVNAINRQGLVVYSLVKRGKPEQQANHALFSRQMASRMAALGHGPLHMGRAVALEDIARFDQVLVIQYPSANYFAELLTSQYFAGVIGENLLGDSLSVFTIPITDRL